MEFGVFILAQQRGYHQTSQQVIQNSIDSQVIQSLSVLNASFQGIDFARTLRMEDLVGRQVSPLP